MIDARCRVTRHSLPHPLMPLRYIEPWRRDMVNRELIINVGGKTNVLFIE